MELHLSEAERELLDEVLKERHMVLEREIQHTDNGEFRRMLRARETMLEDLIERLDAVEIAAD
jgi:hypothetical protein